MSVCGAELNKKAAAEDGWQSTTQRSVIAGSLVS